MTEKENKRPRRKKTSESAKKEASSPNGSNQFLWISTHELRRVIEVMAAADGVSIQEAIDGLNAKINRKELAIFPQIPLLQVK
jgi:hypothetical protein